MRARLLSFMSLCVSVFAFVYSNGRNQTGQQYSERGGDKIRGNIYNTKTILKTSKVVCIFLEGRDRVETSKCTYSVNRICNSKEYTKLCVCLARVE